MKNLFLAFTLLFAFILTANAQNFTFYRVGPSIVSHDTTSFYPVVLKGVFKNTSTITRSFTFIRVLNDLPGPTWTSQLCVGASCYPAEVDTCPPYGQDPITLAPNATDTLYIDVLGLTQGLGTIVMKVFITTLPAQYITDTFRVQLNYHTSIRQISSVVKDFELSQNYPNPFNPVTLINFSIPKKQNVSLKVYNLLGMEVATLVNNENLGIGSYSFDFNANEYGLSSGIYFYRLQAEDFTFTRKMMLTK
ncbi:MAG TPA: T9SS type A sorting domain-containing protein [Ignavibacteria bacterium]